MNVPPSDLKVMVDALAYAIMKNEDYMFEQKFKGHLAPHTAQALETQREVYARYR